MLANSAPRDTPRNSRERKDMTGRHIRMPATLCDLFSATIVIAVINMLPDMKAK